MSPAEERDALISAATTAYRQRDVSGALVVNPAWLDLDEPGRREAYAQTVLVRAVERAVAGQSSTVRAVLQRIRAAR
ncbi:MAG: hypothetical protein AB2A00_12180 [Myxococcota bacterium]